LHQDPAKGDEEKKQSTVLSGSAEPEPTVSAGSGSFDSDCGGARLSLGSLLIIGVLIWDQASLLEGMFSLKMGGGNKLATPLL
jgi:hypothetical protein